MEFFSGSAADMLKKYGQAVPEQQPLSSLEEAQAAKAKLEAEKEPEAHFHDGHACTADHSSEHSHDKAHAHEHDGHACTEDHSHDGGHAHDGGHEIVGQAGVLHSCREPAPGDLIEAFPDVYTEYSQAF